MQNLALIETKRITVHCIEKVSTLTLLLLSTDFSQKNRDVILNFLHNSSNFLLFYETEPEL